MNSKLNQKKKKLIKRSISLAVVFAMLLNELLAWNVLNNVPIIGDIEKSITLEANAAEDPGDDTQFVHNADNTIEVDIVDLVSYSANCQIYSTYHQNDRIIIVAGQGYSDYFESGFQGIGTKNKPFKGSIEMGANTSAVLNLDAPLFNYVYDSVTINNGNSFDISRYYPANATTDKTTPIIAKNVVHDADNSTLRTWNINLVKPSDFNQSTEHNLGEFGGFIGNMCYDSEGDAGAKLSVSVTMNTSGTDTEDIAIAGSGDLGLTCGHMEEKTELTFVMSGTRGISSISTSGGDVGGLVGEMESGAVLNYNSANFLDSGTPVSTTSSGCYAGGIVGKNTGATVNLGTVDLTAEPIVQYTINQYMTGTAGAGGVYGYYKPAEALVSTTVDEVTVDKSVNTKNYNINCQVNGASYTGGLFGVLDAEYDVTINGGGTVTSNHASGSCTSFGGLIGQYNPNSLERTLTVTNVTAVPSKGGSTTYYGGCVGVINSSFNNNPVQSYATFNSVTVNASDAGVLTFGGLVASADNAFIDVNGATVTAGSFKGGGLVGNLDHGVLRLDGTVNLTGATPAAPGTGEENKIGKVVGWRDDALVFAKSSCTLNKSTDTVDDIGSWGQVIRFTAEDSTKSVEKLGGTEVLSVNESTHAVTIAAPSDSTNTYKKIDSVSDYAKTALCFQIDAGNNNFITFADTSYTCSDIGSQNITLTSNVDLSNTGFVNLTRDNNIGTTNAETKCTYAGTAQIPVVFDGKPDDTQYSITYGGSTVYRHSYTGLFGITDNATIQETTFAGNLNVNAKEATMYAGSAAGTSKGTFTATSLTVNTTINHDGDKALYVGGVLGEASSDIGAITVSNITANATIAGRASDTCLGGVIGKISHANNSTSLTWSFSNIDISGSITNETAIEKNQVGGLIAAISGGTGATNRILDLDDITVKGLNISVKSKSNGSVGGVLGYSWAAVDADFDDIEVGTNISGVITTPTITQIDNAATGVDFAGLVYSGSGYWTVKNANDLKITALKLKSENAQSFGMILNRGWIGNSDMTAIDTALYLELQNASSYSITAANVAFKKSDNSTDMTIPVFDELVAHTAFYTGTGASKVAYSGSDPDNLYILQNGQGIVSIQTSGANGGLTMNGSDASGTYTPATTFGKQMNPFARYYYNLYSMKNSTAGAAGLMSWGAKWYAHSSIKTDVSSNTSWESTIPNGTYNMQGYSWYPLNIDTATVSINGTFKLYNREFEASDNYTTNNHVKRTSLYYTLEGDSKHITQHYLMQSALFYNVKGKLNVGTITLQGSVPQIDTGNGKYSGVLILGSVTGTGATESATAKVSTTSVTLDGVYVYNFNLSDDYAPLFINKSGNYSALTINGVKVNADTSYKTNSNLFANDGETLRKVDGYPKIATSLIGDAGVDSTSKNVNVNFTNIQLDGRNSRIVTALDSAYHSEVSLFTKATLLNKLSFDTGKGTYTYTYDDDWGDISESNASPKHNVTYGREVGYTVSPCSINGVSVVNQYPGEEQKYLTNPSGYYTDPTTKTNLSGDYAGTFVSSYLPYVATVYDSENHYYQLEVNHSSSKFDGCGTYNDPYTITDGADFQTIYNILATANDGNPGSIVINIPMSSQTAVGLSSAWHTSYGHTTYYFKGADSADPTNHPAGYYANDEYVDKTNTNKYLTPEKVRTYVAGAYYKIVPKDGGTSVTIPLATSDSGFHGLGNTTDSFAQFRGVIVGTGNESIINKSGYPLIAYSNGSVVKDINIVVDMNTGTDEAPATGNIPVSMSSAAAYTPAGGAKNYGAVIGSVLGGDNIIDGVTVTFQHTTITLSGSVAQLIPVGGYIGVVLNGGVIFRGMEDKTSGISGLPTGVVTAGSTPGVGDASLGDMTSETNMRWLYVNPIIGRVINGYAVNEASAYRPFEDGTRVYHGGARTLTNETTGEEYEDPDGLVITYWDETNQKEVATRPAKLSAVTMRNGNKNYSITDIKPDETKMLDAKTGNAIDVPNAQAFFVMSLIVNSGAGIQKAKNDKTIGTTLGYYTGFYTLRHAEYSAVGSKVNNAIITTIPTDGDYDSNASRDNYYSKLNTDNDKKFAYTPYIIEQYTKSYTESISGTNRVIYYAKMFSHNGGNAYTVSLTGDSGYVYCLPDGYKGLGNVYTNNGYSRLKISSFVGNDKTISQNTTFYYYFKKNSNNNMNTSIDTNYTPSANVGLGLINYQSNDLNAESVTLKGNVIADVIDSSSSTGDHIPYYSKNEGWTVDSGSDGVERTAMQSVGSFIGQTASSLDLTNIILNNIYVKGLRCTGGLIGYSTNNKVTIDVTQDCDKIKVHSASNAGGLIGRKFQGAANINFHNYHLNLTEVICENVGITRTNEDVNYAVGGLIGGARCDTGTNTNADKIYVFENINIGDKDKTDPVTIKCANSSFFTGGLVGVITRSSLKMDNCHIYNLDITSAYYAGGLVGQIATVPNTRNDNRDYNIETFISNCSIEKNEGSSYGKVVSTGKASGGFIGAGKNDLKKDVILTNCYIKGITLSSQLYTGGVAGVWGYVQNDPPQNDCSCLVLRNFSISGCTLKGDDSVGGLVGVLNEQHQVSGHNNDGTPTRKSDKPQYLKGYNVLAKNLSFGAYSGSGSPDNVGYICGFNEKVIQIAGFSRQDDQKNPTMIADLVGKTGTVAWTRENKVDIETVTENTENIFGERTYSNVTSKGYVIFADYNDYANSSTYQNKLFSNVPSVGADVSTMRSKTTVVVETYEDGALSDTDTTVFYGDYDSTATGVPEITYSDGYEEGVSTDYTKTTTTVENENYPYVTSSRNFQIDETNYLTGDGVSSYSYGSSAFLTITNDRKNSSTNKAYTIFNQLSDDAVANIYSEYSDSYTEFKNYLDNNENSGILRFPLLLAEDTNRATLTTLINNYLDTLTNTTYNFADTTNSAVYDVGLYKCTYNPGTKVFDVDASSSSTACLKKMSVTLSGQTSYYFYMEASDVDTGDIPQFSLMDVMFKDPSDTSASPKIAYHLYVPVYVRKVLRYDFNAEIKSGTEYDRAEYLKLAAGLTQNTRSQGLFENIGNPVTIAFEYQYTRSADEWVAALNAGDSLLTNYYKSLTIKNHNGNNWPDVTRLVLVDANNKDKYYYLDTPPTMNNTNTTYISLYDFTDSNGNRFTPTPMQNLMTVTVIQDDDGTLTPTTGNTSTGATVYDGTTYYRPISDSDTSLAASDKYTVTSVSDIKPERYYLSIFTKLDKTDAKIYRYEISSPESFNSTGTGVTYTSTDWNVDNWRANKIDKSTILNLFIGNLYDNDLTLSVTPQKSGSQVMANDNRYLDVKMTANVKLTESAKTAGIPGNMSSFQNKAEIYQTFLMMYDKLNPDNSSEVGISLDADGAVGDISHKYMGGNILPASFDMASATAVDHEQHIISEQYVELRNGQNLIKELYKSTNNYAVTIQVDFEMVYAPNALGYQFPKREDGSLISSGSSVIGYSKIASTVEGAANSAAFDKDTDLTRYYISDESSAMLEYNVVTSRDVAGQYHYLGINSVETGDDECYINTYAVYDTRALKSTGDYIELTLTLSNKSAYVQATVGNPVVSGTALPIEDYLSELKIYGAGDSVIFEQGADPTNTATTVTTDGSTIYKVRVDKSLLKTQTEGVYYIPIDYKVKTGNTAFNNSGHMYSNYKVSLTAAMYPTINSAGNNYSKASYAYDHIIYTNARVIPEVIDP